MNPRRIGTLFGKEFKQGASNFLFVFGIVMPLVFSLLVTMVFGDLFAERPRLGLLTREDSRVVEILASQEHLDATVYSSENSLRRDVAAGVVSVGFIIPRGFDQAVQAGADTDITTLRWGESTLKDMVVIESALLKTLAEVAGMELPLKPQPKQLGTAATATWAERLLPVLVLMAVLLTGMVIPAAGLVDEKHRKTLASLTVTPATLEEVYASKMLLGVVLGVAMAIIVLVMNGALGGQFGLLIGVLVFVAFAASVLGVLLGSYVDDQDAFMGFMKATGIVLYGPGLLELIPQAPEWVARIIPTYYLMNPVLEVSQRGASLGDIAGDLLILAGLTAVMLVALRYVLQQQKVKVGVEA